MDTLPPTPHKPHSLRVFMTGASGCIGHYILDLLLESDRYELFLLLRHPEKLRLPVLDNPRVHILRGGLEDIDSFVDLLPTIDIAILTAAAWGGDPGYVKAINVEANLGLLAHLDPDRCQQVIYFSTASILNQSGSPLPEAGTIGTDYIRTKYDCHRHLPDLPIYDKITTVFPTLVFGGDKDKPYSFISAGLRDVTRWVGLARFFKADAGFHFAHAQDIAAVVIYLVEHPPQQGYREYVIGNPPLTVNQAIAQICDYFGQRIWFRIPLSLWLADVLIKVFRVQMAPWDYFCLRYRHFVYSGAVNPASFGMEPYCATLADLMRVHGIKGRRKKEYSL
ncbi:NAD-dependent epimerase/dehydratase family protein [Nodosilinea sp. PGN35]|uniref:NAD-dependent epimerase/dehydratase family protein n=1 Tax=Nodosilinea sp. PGN35 TaxID=3020489 RepID=UPI0023B25477|nr:NAD(P)-dependent oxidoreductase [Nodosilinea sp. TSF1-S3]MDF0364805.1 NAD(P)-dependent oxidoreductase [Nodosilinea sp. TSF1-S3]